jgi:hypothetical protein
MKTLDEIMDRFTGPSILHDLAGLLREHDSEFPDTEKKYHAAVSALRAQLGEAAAPSLDAYLSACRREVIADILYAAYLGYRVNLENFHSPCKFDFASKDFTHLIRDHLMGTFPVCQEARATQEAFRKALPKETGRYQDAIRAYFIALDTAGPKLAHYAGYAVANKFLPWVEPGYREDYLQTVQYRREIKDYLGFLPFTEAY